MIATVLGEPLSLPPALLAQHPELAEATYRRGGLPPRIGGWCLGARTVAAITLWDTVWIAPGAQLSEELLLHELRHVRQFQAVPAFPLRYLWESLTRGYSANRFEVEARLFVRERLRRDGRQPPAEDV